MSRSGYSEGDGFENWSLIRWRGAVTSALRGKRGQAFLREALAALDAMPAKELIPNDLAAEGSFCTLGAVGAARGLPLGDVDPEDYDRVAGMFGLPGALAREIMWENDERFGISAVQVGHIQSGKYWSHLPYSETRAGDWWAARQRGERLSAHELRCESCGEPSTAAVCVACIETALQSEIHQ